MKRKEDFMKNEPVGKLLMKLSIPAMIGTSISIIYHLVDTIFIGRGVSINGIGAVTLSFPIIMIMMAVAMMIGSGGASMISRYYGEGNKENAYKVAGNILSILMIISVSVLLLGKMSSDYILKLLGAQGEQFVLAKEYFSIILLGIPFVMVALGLNFIVQAEGKTKVVMKSMILSTLINLVLDYVFIFNLHLGMRGAALATVIAQAVWCFVLGYFLKGENSALELRRYHLLPKAKVIKRIFELGSSVFIRQAGMSFVLIIINYSLGSLGGPLYISIFGAIQRILRVVMVPLSGLAQGFKPIVGFNLGAGKINRVCKTLKLALLISCGVGVLGFSVLYFMPGILLKMFSSDVVFIETGKSYLRLVVIILPLVGVNYIGTEFFLAMGKAKKALLLGISRQILFLLPLVMILPRFIGIKGVLYAFPISDLLACILSGIYLFKFVRKLNSENLTNISNGL